MKELTLLIPDKNAGSEDDTIVTFIGNKNKQ